MFLINSSNIAGWSVHPEQILPMKTHRGQQSKTVFVKNTQRTTTQNCACQEHTEESWLSDKEIKIYYLSPEMPLLVVAEFVK